MKGLVATLSLALISAGCGTPPIAVDRSAAVRFFLETGNNDGVRVVLPQSETGIFVGVKPVFTEFDIVRVEMGRVEWGGCLLFQLTPAAARDLYRLTDAHSGRRLVLAVNDVVMGVCRIDQPLSEGRIMIFVETPDEKLPALQAQLSASSAELQRVARKR